MFSYLLTHSHCYRAILTIYDYNNRISFQATIFPCCTEVGMKD